ncbi:MAG TPA: PPC domain-containing protein [Kofleriaceae bacterium]|jgi:hypothetical protein
MKRPAALASLLTAALAVPAVSACTTESDVYDDEAVKSEDGKADSSALAVFLDFEFDGKVRVDSSWDDKQTIQDQLMFTVGMFNGSTAVGRVDKVALTNIRKTTVGGKTEISYHAKLPVSWGNRNSIPNTYEMKLPLDMSDTGQQAFMDKFKDKCVDYGAHDLDVGSMFYYYRPKQSGCTISTTDASVTTATISPSANSTTGKFPEMNKVWEDGTLNVVAIFGKFEDGATTGDVGIAGFNEFVGAMKTELGSHNLVTIPANVPNNPGVASPDIEFSATLADGKKVHVVAMLTDNVDKGLAEPAFRDRYESLSTRADFIVYNGHAGLGSNIRSLASKGKWTQGQYVVVYMNGCDTFAYVDDSLSSAHRAVNPDDTTGFKYMDMINNSMPAFFASMSGATMAVFRGLMSYDAPVTYEQMFKNVDSSQVVMVTGEQDNVFTPGGGGQPQVWAGISETGTIAKGASKSWTTPTLAAGKYEFAMTPNGSSGGDADLYVRIGSAPTATKYDCRPYKTGSNETCQVELGQPSAVFVQVKGYATSSKWKLTGRKL